MTSISSSSSLSSSCLPSTSTSSRTNPEVFLSFSCSNTCKGYTDGLYTRLIDAGINVLRDNDELHLKIRDALLDSIKQSKISIPVISKDYAACQSCLMGLAQMLECEKANNQLIVPIFYDIDPADLKCQRGCVGESFSKHEDRGVDCEDIAKWKQALREIVERKEYDLLNTNNRHQGDHIKTVVSYILQLLKKNDLVVIDSLVGIDPHVQEVTRKLGVVYVNEEAVELCDKDVRVLGICGVPGIGKTTIAKVVYNKIRHLFQGCSFLSNIQETVESNGLMGLQIQLISDLQKQESRRLSIRDEIAKVIANSFGNMKVLIVIDNVSDFGQIKHLVGNLNWFGLGSRILMTVGRNDVLDDYGNGVAIMYEVGKMGPYQDKVQEVIKASYGALDEEARNLFLSMACFCNGEDERIPSYMWHASKYNPLKGIKFLLDMGLVKKGENNELWMPNQVREFGREIVRMEDPNEPLKRTRLWNHSDALSTLNGEESATNVDSLCLMFDEGRRECFRSEASGHPCSVRFLRLDQAAIEGSSQKVLSNLRWLHWQGCRKISELLIFHMENLVILNLSCSLVTGDSQVWGQILEKAKGLKILILSGCPHLHKTPDFPLTRMPLEGLVLERCLLLSQISRSIGNLNKLVSLNLKFCKLVKHLPGELCYMTALEELLIDGTSISTIHFPQTSMQRLKTLSACRCESLVQISGSIGHLKSLLYLGLDGAAIDSLPYSIGSLKKLQKLLLGNCRKLAELPYSIGNLELLEFLNLSSTAIARLPKSFKGLQKLKVLKMEDTHLRGFPKEIEDLKMLEEIDLSQCKNLKRPIYCHFNRLSSLKIFRLSSTKTSGLPWSDDRFSAQQTLKSLSHLQQLDFSDCDQVRALPILPSSLSSLRWVSKKMRTVPDFSYLPNLKELHLGDGTDPKPKSSSEPPQIGWLTSLVNLEILELGHSKISSLPEKFSALPLRKLVLHHANLLDLQELPSSILTLCLRCCTIQVPRFSKMRCLSELELKHCDLPKIDGLEDLKLLRLLHISHCSVQTLDGLESMPRLRKLTLFECPSLTDLPDQTKCEFEIDMCNP